MLRGIDPADVALCVADEAPPADAPQPVTTSIVQTALFTFPDFASLLDGLAAEHEHTVYTRGRNPTVQAVERCIARLERGEAALCFASGMAAISAVLLGTLQRGDHLLFVNQTYGPTLQLAAHMRRFGIEHDVVLDVRHGVVESALRPNTRLIWLESPGTMLFRLLDVRAITDLARARGIPTCMDNSWATPLFQKPIEMGVDLVVHSASKYLGGHGDLMAGALVSTAARLEEFFYRAYLLNGGILSPFDGWLLHRGLRTLPARMRQHEADALRIAEWLSTHDAVRDVYHPALVHGDDALAAQLAGTSGLFSFTLRRPDFESVRGVIDALRHFRIGVSWGGVESLVISPERGDNATDLETQQIPRGLIRLSVGLEGADVLIEDLDRALTGIA
jgi:cystathionine beta-lyase/cystathionine gamma-synthase